MRLLAKTFRLEVSQNHVVSPAYGMAVLNTWLLFPPEVSTDTFSSPCLREGSIQIKNVPVCCWLNQIQYELETHVTKLTNFPHQELN